MESERRRSIRPSISVVDFEGFGVEDEAVAVELAPGLTVGMVFGGGKIVWIGEEGCASCVGGGGSQGAGVVDAGCSAGGVEVEGKGFRGDGGQRVGVLPALGSGSGDIVGDVILQEAGLCAGAHGPVVPLAVETEEVEKAGGAEVLAAEVCLGFACAGVIPRSL